MAKVLIQFDEDNQLKPVKIEGSYDSIEAIIDCLRAEGYQTNVIIIPSN